MTVRPIPTAGAIRSTPGGDTLPVPLGPAPAAPLVRVPRWEHFDHGADIGVRGVASTKAAAFEQAALALAAVVTPPSGVAPLHTVTVSCRAVDDEGLLVAWLNALVFEMAARHMVFHDFAVTLADHHLHASARGEPLRAGHQAAVEVKGATYTALRVDHQDGPWVAQAVIDV